MLQVIPMWEVHAQTNGGDTFTLRVAEPDLRAVVNSLVLSRAMNFEARLEPDRAFDEQLAAQVGRWQYSAGWTGDPGSTR